MSPGQFSVETILVPVDGSDESLRAVEYGGAIAERYDSTVHVVYVLGEFVVRDIETGTISAEDVAEDNRAFMNDARDILETFDTSMVSSIAYGFSTHRKLHHPGSVILDAAHDIEADFIVIPREPVQGAPGEVLEKAAEYVLLYATQPVLSV